MSKPTTQQPPAATINIFESPDFPGTEEHSPTCECYPCQQANYRMNRDDPSAGGDDVIG